MANFPPPDEVRTRARRSEDILTAGELNALCHEPPVWFVVAHFGRTEADLWAKLHQAARVFHIERRNMPVWVVACPAFVTDWQAEVLIREGWAVTAAADHDDAWERASSTAWEIHSGRGTMPEVDGVVSEPSEGALVELIRAITTARSKLIDRWGNADSTYEPVALEVIAELTEALDCPDVAGPS